MYGNPNRGYRTTIPFIIYDEHKVYNETTNEWEVSETCDLIQHGRYNPDGSFTVDPSGTALRINVASACYLENSSDVYGHAVDLMYSNFTDECKLNVIDYMIGLVYFAGSGEKKNDNYSAKNVLVQSMLPDYSDEYYTDEPGNFNAYSSNLSIPDGAMRAYELLFQRLKERECNVLFRVGYHGYVQNLSSASADIKNDAYTSEKVMMAHIEQFGEFFQTCEAASVVSKVSSGFIGQGGEMVNNYQWPTFTTDNYNNVMKAVVEDICIPNGIPYTVRMPSFWENFVNAYPQYQQYVGFNNDALFGETDEYGYCSGCWQYNHSASICYDANHSGTCKDPDGSWWELVCENAAFTPQSGEMYHNLHTKYQTCTKAEHINDGCYVGKQRIPTGFDVIKELAHFRYSTLSQWNGLMEGGYGGYYAEAEQGRYSLDANGNYISDPSGEYVRVLRGWPDDSIDNTLTADDEYAYYIYCKADEVKYNASGSNVGVENGTHVWVSPSSVMQYWIDNEVVTMEWLDDNGIIYDPAWFYDDNGNLVKRNTFEFIRDHLGYKLVAQDIMLRGVIASGGNVFVDLALKNYGFAAAFGLESSFVILDANGNEVSKVSVGDPSKWYNLPTDYYTEDRSESVQDDVLVHSLQADMTLPSESGTYRLALLLENESGDTARLSNANANGFSYTADSNSSTTGYNVLYTFTIN